MAAIRGGFNYPGMPTETWSAQTPTGTILQAFKKIDARLKNMIMAGVYAMNDTAKALAFLGAEKIRQDISKQGNYKPYYDKGRLRYSSQPGTPPAATKGGTLESSIYAQLNSRAKDNPAVAEFGVTAPFARELEYGTPRIPARPFMLPARQYVASIAEDVVKVSLERAYERNIRKQNQKGNNIVIDLGF